MSQPSHNLVTTYMGIVSQICCSQGVHNSLEILYRLQISSEIFEPLLILKSEIFSQLVRYSIYFQLQIHKSSITGADQYIGRIYSCRTYSALHHKNHQFFLYRRLSKATYRVQLDFKNKMTSCRRLHEIFW